MVIKGVDQVAPGDMVNHQEVAHVNQLVRGHRLEVQPTFYGQLLGFHVFPQIVLEIRIYNEF